MALVSYEVSDESEDENITEAYVSPESRLGLELENTKCPKSPNTESSLRSSVSNSRKNEKMTKPVVKITVPSLTEVASDDDDISLSKSRKNLKEKSSLFSLLPPPKTSCVKEANRPLVPHALRKGASSSSLKVGSELAKKRIKLSTDSEFLSIADLETDDDSETQKVDTVSGDFFSLNSGDYSHNTKSNNLSESIQGTSSASLDVEFNSVSNTAALESLNLPFSFHKSPQYVPITHSSNDSEPLPENRTANASADIIPIDNKNLELDEEALRRLCGRNSKYEQNVQFIDMHEDSLMSDSSVWLAKQLTEEKKSEIHSHSRRKSEFPSAQQRRKHQITYLAFQAKENELELKNQWSQNRISRKQTQSKYGF